MKQRLIVIDDSFIVRTAWRIKNESSFDVTTFESPEAFFDAFPDKNSFENIFLIICDFHFEHKMQTGAEIIEYIKSTSPETKVYLSSFGVTSLDGIPADGMLEKEPRNLSCFIFSKA